MSRWHRVYWAWAAVFLAFFVAANAIWSVEMKAAVLGFPFHYLTRQGIGEAEFHWPALAANVVVGVAATLFVPWLLATLRSAPSPHPESGSAEPGAAADRGLIGGS
jgi:hypothetical protein